MPTFKDVIEFLKEMAYVANHPFFSESTCSTQTKHKGTFQVEKRNLNVTTYQVTPKCYMYSGAHKLHRCKGFKTKTVKERKDFVKAHGLCFNYISSQTHFSRGCPSKERCKECKKLHHTLLHIYKVTPKKEDDESAKPDASKGSQQCNATSSKQSPLLQVVPVTVIGKEKRISTYALIDSGSDTTMIDESLADKLNIKGREEVFTVNTAVMKNVQRQSTKVNLRIALMDLREKVPVEIPTAWTIKDLSIPVRHMDKDVRDLPHLKAVPFPEV